MKMNEENEFIRFESEIDKLEALKLTYVSVPVAILEQLKGEFNKGKFSQRLIIRVNQSETWQCGVVALGNGLGYITVKTAILKKNKLKIGDKVEVFLKPDESEYGMEVPEELQVLLDQDEEGNRRFHLLSKGKQRYIIYYILQVKSSQLRIDKAIRIIRNLKNTVEGKEDFKYIFSK